MKCVRYHSLDGVFKSFLVHSCKEFILFDFTFSDGFLSDGLLVGGREHDLVACRSNFT